jgi:hypothetical protein
MHIYCVASVASPISFGHASVAIMGYLVTIVYTVVTRYASYCNWAMLIAVTRGMQRGELK